MIVEILNTAPKSDLKTLRESIGMSRKDFCESLGIPIRTVEDWEAGRRKMPDYLLRLILYKVKIENWQKNNLKETEENKKHDGEKTGNVNIICDAEGKKIVLINDIRFRGKKREEWEDIKQYLMEYVGNYYEIEESSDIIYIDSDFPDEFTSSESRLALKGMVAKGKANASQGIPELIQIATNEVYSENIKAKHRKDAKLGWYRYDVRFALPVYDDKSGELVRYNIFSARMLVRHAEDGKKYLYDLLAVKKETSSPLK